MIKMVMRDKTIVIDNDVYNELQHKSLDLNEQDCITLIKVALAENTIIQNVNIDRVISTASNETLSKLVTRGVELYKGRTA